MNKFDQIVVSVLRIAEADIRDDLTPQDVPEWDSMNYLLFVAELEKEFDISLTMDEVLNAKSLGDVRTAVRAKGIDV